MKQGLTSNNIDAYVEYWHNNEVQQSLSKFLGMSSYEYEVWLQKGNDAIQDLKQAENMKFRGEYYFLSNMYPAPVTINLEGISITFPCAETAYQACKDPTKWKEFITLNGYDAKKLGRKVKLRADWNRVQLSTMETIIRAKFIQHPELMRKLKAVTGEIVENNTWGDTFWGVCNGSGLNFLGKILMRIRDETVIERSNTMERLTVKAPSGLIHLKDNLEMTVNIAIKKLSDYEDLEEQGRLPKLPCKVGDTVYRVYQIHSSNSIMPETIERIEIYKDIIVVYDTSDNEYYTEDFGKTIFHTPEEAEAALLEMEELQKEEEEKE